MTCFKRIILALTVLILTMVCGYMIYRINIMYPSPENVAYQPGDTAKYKGMFMHMGEIELYDSEEAAKTYPELADLIRGETEQKNWFIVNLELENSTEQKISFGKESIAMCVIEVGLESNGIGFQEFMALNPDYKSSLEPGESMQVKLPYSIWEKYISPEEVENTDIKLVYSYYPTKNYILYSAEERKKS